MLSAMAEDPKPDLRRVSVTMSGAMAHALDADASGRMLSRAAVIREALNFDLSARSRAGGALDDAMAARGEAARRLAAILANPATDRMGRRLDAVARASRHARAVRNPGRKSDA